MIKILDYSALGQQIFNRTEQKFDVEKIVADIIENVKTNGDDALKYYTEKFDKAKLDDLLVSQKEFDDAFEEIDEEEVDVRD